MSTGISSPPLRGFICIDIWKLKDKKNKEVGGETHAASSTQVNCMFINAVQSRLILISDENG